MFLEISNENGDNNGKDKGPRDRSPPFSEEQLAFLRSLVDERDLSGKGKEPAKKSTKEADKQGERIGLKVKGEGNGANEKTQLACHWELDAVGQQLRWTGLGRKMNSSTKARH